VNLVPWPLWGDGAWSDGRWLFCWLLMPRRAAQRRAVSALELTTAQRPSEWDARWIDLAIGDAPQPSNPDAVIGNLLAYGWALDRGQVDQAAQFLARALAARRLVSPVSRAALLLEAAFLAARFNHDQVEAERLLAEADQASDDPSLASDHARAEAAIHLESGRYTEALAACQRAADGLPRIGQPYGSFAVLDREHIAAIREETLRALGRQGIVNRVESAEWGAAPDRS
jgi:tetratricopeptide (TPR) repeat protein